MSEIKLSEGPVEWYLKCKSCDLEYSKRGMALNPSCPKCGKPGDVLKRVDDDASITSNTNRADDPAEVKAS